MFKLVVSDCSGDGHERKDTFIVRGYGNIEDDYARGVKLCGIDITKYCQDFEDDKIPVGVWDKIAKLLGEPFEIDPDDDEDDYVHIYSEDYIAIYLAIANLGAGKEAYVLADDIDNRTINIGGYGLFSC